MAQSRVVLEASEGSECLGKLLKFPAPDRIETLVESAQILKARHFQKDDKGSPSAKKPVSPHKKTNSMASWMANSLDFFQSGHIHVPSEEQKSVKPIEADVKPAPKGALERVDACIAILTREAGKAKSSEGLRKCINLLEDVKTELK